MFESSTVKVVIPALNEAASIGQVLEHIPGWVDEVIVCDNGSSDDTSAVAVAGGARVVRDPVPGYGRACLAALAAVGDCDVIVFLDADASDDPAEMNSLVAPIAAGDADLVIGARVVSKRQAGSLTAPQRFGNWLACKLMRLFWGGAFSDLGPFRAIRYSSLQRLRMTDPTYGWTVEMQIKALIAGLKVAEVPVSYRRRIGKSKISGTVRGVIGAGAKILGTIGRYLIAPPRSDEELCGRLIVFTRLPSPGRTKTRLIPAIGALKAAELQRRMTLRTAEIARQLDRADLEIRFAGGTEKRMQRWLGDGFVYRQQKGDDLGQRMRDPFDDGFKDGCQKVVIVGTDCPALDADRLAEAFDALDEHDVVLGPSADGGYYLIGLRRSVDLFEGIQWGGDSVLAATLEKAAATSLSVRQLGELSDIDRPEDIEELPADLQVNDPVISVIIPALNEQAGIAAAIESARCEGVEIIVVDGQSDDETASIAASAGARMIPSAPGRAQQMNAGAASASGDVLLFLHADSTLPANYAAGVFEALLDQSIVGGAHKLKSDPPKRGLGIVNALAHLRTRLSVPYGDQAIFIRREVFEELGGYDQVPIAEDLLFARRANRKGRMVLLDSHVTTSSRRWQNRGLIKQFMINQAISIGCRIGIPIDSLARLYES